ncbi:MAG TPA: GntR family transcriptional regulator [Anaerolineae bacterium]|nr:GntR family transcriptional regulator [Anaerolineae bacterium]HMR62704.1 GntR family transcriptional regulator [Anaerolineae bacterium]
MAESSLSVNIFDILKKRIIRWEYLPGQRLTEESLCAEFGVSRVPVREALQMLEDNQLIDKVRYRGCTVKQPDLAEINELYDVRLALELFVVEHLGLNGLPPDTWQQLHQVWSDLLQETSPASIDSLRLARLDETFHETLAQAVGNQSLSNLLHNVNERLYFTRMTDITTVDRLHHTCRQHLEILDCIRKRDTLAARAAIQANIAFGRNNVESALKDALARAYMSN